MRFTITLAAITDDGSTCDIPVTTIERADDTFTIDDLGLRIEVNRPGFAGGHGL